MARLAETLFAREPAVRYVAVYTGGEPELHERAGLSGASSSTSDWYEEVLVNPTVIALTRQRGEIDCGGLEYLLVRYGNFFQLVCPIPGGHVSVAVEPVAHLLDVVEVVRSAIKECGLV